LDPETGKPVRLIHSFVSNDAFCPLCGKESTRPVAMLLEADRPKGKWPETGIEFPFQWFGFYCEATCHRFVFSLEDDAGRPVEIVDGEVKLRPPMTIPPDDDLVPNAKEIVLSILGSVFTGGISLYELRMLAKIRKDQKMATSYDITRILIPLVGEKVVVEDTSDRCPNYRLLRNGR
jgi:hypothetical protein